MLSALPLEHARPADEGLHRAAVEPAQGKVTVNCGKGIVVARIERNFQCGTRP